MSEIPVMNPKLEDILLDDKPKPKELFSVDTTEKAVWAAKKYLEAKERVESRLEQNLSFKAKIDSWSERSNSDDIATMEYMQSILEPYAKKVVDKQKKSRSLKLPEVTINFRKSPEKVIFDNEDMIIDFCKTNLPKALETKTYVLKTVLKNLLTEGEIIPGVSIVKGPEKMIIKPT